MMTVHLSYKNVPDAVQMVFPPKKYGYSSDISLKLSTPAIASSPPVLRPKTADVGGPFADLNSK